MSEPEADGLAEAIVILKDLLDSLPIPHHERPGIIRSIEVLEVDHRRR